MAPKIFIDGEHGTTGLQIRQRLAERRDLQMLSIPEAERRNAAMRRGHAEFCRYRDPVPPDDASIEAAKMTEGNNSVRPPRCLDRLPR